MAQRGGGIAQAPITKESRGRGTAAVRGDTGRPLPSAPTPVIPVKGSLRLVSGQRGRAEDKALALQREGPRPSLAVLPAGTSSEATA